MGVNVRSIKFDVPTQRLTCRSSKFSNVKEQKKKFTSIPATHPQLIVPLNLFGLCWRPLLVLIFKKETIFRDLPLLTTSIKISLQNCSKLKHIRFHPFHLYIIHDVLYFKTTFMSTQYSCIFIPKQNRGRWEVNTVTTGYFGEKAKRVTQQVFYTEKIAILLLWVK